MKTKLIALSSIFLLILIGVGAYIINQEVNEIPTNTPRGEYGLVIGENETLDDVALQLEEDEVITSSEVFLLRKKIRLSSNIQKGEYILDLPANQTDILNQMEEQSKEKIRLSQEENSKNSVSITIKEGLDLQEVATILEEKKVIDSKDDFLEYAKVPENFDRQKYSFLPEPLNCQYGNLDNCALYYPEGYLYPDTYDFFEGSSYSEVYNKMLNNFDNKVWADIAEENKNEAFHKAIIMASVIELETGRTKGVTVDSVDDLKEERKLMAGVFYNRLESGMMWQSDVTAAYGHGRTICQSTVEIEDCIYLKDPAADTLFNTYLHEGYPVGPIVNPQFENIQAALNPTNNNYLFFVADATGKKYFSSTNEEHEQNVAKVNEINSALGL
jgi:UPF0755 protein